MRTYISNPCSISISLFLSSLHAVCQPAAVLAGLSFLQGSCFYSIKLDAWPPFPRQGQPPFPRCCRCGSKPHAPSVSETRCLLLPAGASQHTQGCFNFTLLPSVHRLPDLPFPICSTLLSPGSLQLQSGLIHRPFPLRGSSSLSLLGLGKAVTVAVVFIWISWAFTEAPSPVRSVMGSGHRHFYPGTMRWGSLNVFPLAVTLLKEQIPHGVQTHCPAQIRAAKPSPSRPGTTVVLLAAPRVSESCPFARFPLPPGPRSHADSLTTAEICEY